MSVSRPIQIAGNWKMNLDRATAEEYCARLAAADLPPEIEVLLFPPHTLVAVVSAALAQSTVSWGGQDLHPASAGAHTGDVSAKHLLDWGSTWVLCGHSERRQNHGEADALVSQKVVAAQAAGLAPVLCVGETQAEREAGATEDVLRRQIESALPAADGRFSLAYEPVWAIGTGATATPALAQEVHAFLRGVVVELRGQTSAESCSILYGGSVKSANCEELLAEADVDGFLIGGASLDPESFLDIIRRCGSAA